MINKPETITFLCELQDSENAISLSGSHDKGARIRLDLPASEVGAAILLQQKGAGKLLKVTIEVQHGPLIIKKTDGEKIADSV